MVGYVSKRVKDSVTLVGSVVIVAISYLVLVSHSMEYGNTRIWSLSPISAIFLRQ